jgi:hypothetical protein
MTPRLVALAVLAACAFAGSAGAAPMTRDQHRAEIERIQGVYRAANDNCKPMKGNARDICKVEARGAYNIAKAELELKKKATPKHDDKLKTARAEAAYRLASEKCDDMQGSAREICRKEAKASWIAARGDTRVSRAAIDDGVNSRKANAERKEAREDNSAAQYAAAKERCEVLPGDARASCVGDLKKKFGKM